MTLAVTQGLAYLLRRSFDFAQDELCLLSTNHAQLSEYSTPCVATA